MRRDFRRKQNNDKILLYSAAGIVLMLTIVFALIMYGNSLNKEAGKGKLSSEQIASIVKNEADLESASSSIGKTVEEAEKNEAEASETTNTENTTNSDANIAKNENVIENNTSTSDADLEINIDESNKNTTATTNAPKSNSQAKESKKELAFQKPVEGDIVKEFAKENLVFSETLQEWVTHNGIDIKADKTTVVQAAEDGTIKTIKNDPRYGLTIVIEHENGFQTVYANLLSSEFVTEGENVVKGQAIGTVGNTAAFESADEPHLHFEILKDAIQVDPSIYLK